MLFIMIFVGVLLMTTLYIPADIFCFCFKKRMRQGTCIRIKNTMHKIAVTSTLLLWGLMIWGAVWGTSAFTLRTIELKFSKLPESFDGIRIIHFSDTHLGSFLKYSSVEKGVQIIIDAKPDLVLFTGDLVNISDTEAKPYIELFSQIEAPYGKYAVLGNHDMSDYMKMDIPRDSVNVNTFAIEQILEEMGFVVLRNSSVTIHNETDSIYISGSDNWGKPPFKTEGRPDIALQNLNPEVFSIFLSHDPSVWTAMIVDHPNADLTLSGHTHGMQLGIKTDRFRWSPASLKYPQWGGVYQTNAEKVIHVNTGFGFIGFPSRMGIRPEITLLILRN